MTNAVAESGPLDGRELAEADDGAWPKPLYAWYVVSILLVAYSFAILDRSAIGLLVDPIKADLHISDTQIGLLQGLAFAICYTIVGLPLGYLADRWRRKPLLTIGIAAWSAATVVCGVARTFGILFVGRVGVGVGEATLTPTAGSLISDYFPPERRAKAYGFWMLGGSAGVGLSLLFVAAAILVANHLHAIGTPWAANLKVWQLTFFLIGAPGLLVALLVHFTVREPERRGMRVDASDFPLRPIWNVLKANPKAYLALGGGAVLNVTAVYAQLGWMPTLFMRVFYWSPAKIGAAFSAISLSFGMVSALIAGWGMAWLIQRGRNDSPILMTMGQSVGTLVFGVSACLAPSPEITLAFMGLSAVTSTWANAAAMTGLSQITPNELRGQVLAIYTLFTGLVSMTFGALLVGMLSDTVFRDPKGVAFSLATVFAACAILAFIVLALGRRAYARAEWNSRKFDRSERTGRP